MTSWPRPRNTGMTWAALAMETSRSSLVPPNSTAVFMAENYTTRDIIRCDSVDIFYGSQKNFSAGNRALQYSCSSRDSAWKNKNTGRRIHVDIIPAKLRSLRVAGADGRPGIADHRELHHHGHPVDDQQRRHHPRRQIRRL